MGDGRLPVEQTERLSAIGDWISRNGEAIGKGLKYGVSMIKTAAKYSPIGLAMQGIHKAGGLKGIWDKTKHMAGAARGGMQKAAHATSSLLTLSGVICAAGEWRVPPAS